MKPKPRKQCKPSPYLEVDVLEDPEAQPLFHIKNKKMIVHRTRNELLKYNKLLEEKETIKKLIKSSQKKLRKVNKEIKKYD